MSETSGALGESLTSGVAPKQNGITGRERFLRACRRLTVDRPPIWMMRQAGRALPEYRALKENYTFLQLVQTPELAAEVSLQPIRRFGFDAAIIFSDILVVPEAMGVGYSFRDTGGVQMNFRIESADQIRKLAPDRVAEALEYVSEAIRVVKMDLEAQTALLGFVGSPWTLANFMLEGGSCKEPSRALELFQKDRGLFEELCEKLTSAIITFLRSQIDAGVDAVQIFDTLGGLLPPKGFRAASAVWMQEVVASINERVPVIVFAKGSREWIDLASTEAEVIGVDHGTSLTEARTGLGPKYALQGNLDPAVLVNETPTQVRTRTEALLDEMEDDHGYIFNLGHGVLPETRLENIAAVVETVRSRGGTKIVSSPQTIAA